MKVKIRIQFSREGILRTSGDVAVSQVPLPCIPGNFSVISTQLQ